MRIGGWESRQVKVNVSYRFGEMKFVRSEIGIRDWKRKGSG